MRPVPAAPGLPLDEIRPRPHLRHAAIGFFDGIHLGHQAVIQAVATAAAGGPVAAVTFEPHPLKIIAPERAPQRLTLPPLRDRRLRAAGASEVVCIQFDDQIRNLEAEAFVAGLRRIFPGLRTIAVGEHWSFGRNRSGTALALAGWGRGKGFDVIAVPHVNDASGRPISSTRIREAIAQGAFDLAASLLGRPYELAAPVVPGRQLGRRLGFPTANLDTTDLLHPPTGVYAARAAWDGSTARAVVNIGTRPTVTPAGRMTVEAHLLDASPDLYGRELELSHFIRLREERAFPAFSDLQAQIERDVAQARATPLPD
jgi:riboflavin kinase / FMN adenylyltransferase